jgi:ABC-type uncharacterized transport system permease subunit
VSHIFINNFQAFLFFTAVIGYPLLWLLIFRSRSINLTKLQSNKFALASVPVLFAHFLFLTSIIYQESGIFLGLVNVCCLIGWLTASLTIFSSLYRPTINLSLFAFPLACLSVLAVFLFPSQPTQPLINIELSTLSHILLSLLAFSIFTISAGQAIFIASMDYQLRHKLARSWHNTFPPLQTLERSLFEMISLGWIFLSFSIVSGLLFLDDMFAQHLAHKTFFSIFSWLVFLILLIGRIKLGWRGTRAIQITLGGYSLLFLAFIGSKFVLEIILERI